jgi:hypothetical protein
MVIKPCPLPDFPDYLVSENGDVYSLVEQGRWRKRRCVPYRLKERLDTKGYVRLRLCNVGKFKNAAVHQLVALAFVGPKPFERAVIRHLDGTRTNNHFTNLAWGTHAENSADMVRHGRAKGGGSRKLRKYTPWEMQCVRWFKDSGISIKEAARLTGMSETHAARVMAHQSSDWYRIKNKRVIDRVAA